MRKPVQPTSVTIQLPDDWTPEQKAKVTQAAFRQIQRDYEQQKRDYDMYEQGRQSGLGIFRIFGF